MTLNVLFTCWKVLEYLLSVYRKNSWKRCLENDQVVINSGLPTVNCRKCDSPQDFNAKGESTRTTRFHFKTKEFILTRFSTLAILPH